MDDELPFPPLEMRRLVGPTDETAFDNPSGALIYGDLVDPEHYDSVLDFGCGCGRNARRLLQQDPVPARYLGLDLHEGMIRWCQAHLAPAHDRFAFVHHDVHNRGFNPSAAAAHLPFPTDEQFSLVLAHSVFTHILPDDTEHYLREIRRVLAPGGRAVTTWFFFDKRYFPMMQDFQNALFINTQDPTNAVIFDRTWFTSALADAGLALGRAIPPEVKGFQWVAVLGRAGEIEAAPLPDTDDAPFGVVRAAAGIEAAHLIGSPPVPD